MADWKIGIVLVAIFVAVSCGRPGNEITDSDDLPPIFPDYCNVTIPANIAPLNFNVRNCEKSEVVIKGSADAITIKSGEHIRIPLSKWCKLLDDNRGKDLTVTVIALADKKWTRYRSFTISIKSDPVDPYIAYRLIAPGYEAYSGMGIYQRDLTSFRQRPFITNRHVNGTCMNCHSFNSGDPDKMMFHIRGDVSGTILLNDGKITRLNTKTSETISNCIYPFWHPSGDYIAFSVNNISQVFHSVSSKRIEVFDSKSDIVVYDIRNNKLITTRFLSSEECFETFPAFTPDGKTLVFCSAERVAQPFEYEKALYSLCQLSFDPLSGTFGDRIDTLVSSRETGKSISFPRVSPDGKRLVFTLSGYGNFSIWHRDADLYSFDLSTGRVRNIEEINSTESDSYHSWSSNSRWMLFSSRRTDGLYTRLFIAYCNSDGSFSKPFMLPLKNPESYSLSLLSYNVPEFVSGEIVKDTRSLLKAIASQAKDVNFEIKER